MDVEAFIALFHRGGCGSLVLGGLVFKQAQEAAILGGGLGRRFRSPSQ